MQKTKVYCAFPGTGKTHFFKNNQGKLKVSDSDSSLFSWTKNDQGERVRNPEFPANYVKHIQRLIYEGYAIVFVSTHTQVIEALIEAGVEITIIKPHDSLKDVYIERYKRRGSDEAFINLMRDSWDMFMQDLRSHKQPTITLMTEGAYIENSITFPTP